MSQRCLMKRVSFSENEAPKILQAMTIVKPDIIRANKRSISIPKIPNKSMKPCESIHMPAMVEEGTQSDEIEITQVNDSS